MIWREHKTTRPSYFMQDLARDWKGFYHMTAREIKSFFEYNLNEFTYLTQFRRIQRVQTRFFVRQCWTNKILKWENLRTYILQTTSLGSQFFDLLLPLSSTYNKKYIHCIVQAKLGDSLVQAVLRLLTRFSNNTVF